MTAGSLQMPNPSSDTPPVDTVAHEGSIVIVGANGTGKSRLGAWLEQRSYCALPQGSWEFDVRRISAQRTLSLPDVAGRVARAEALRQVALGGDHAHQQTRVAGDAVTGQMTDFSYVVQALFAERDAQALAFMSAMADEQRPLVRPTESILTKLSRVWQTIFPERLIMIGNDDNSIRVQSPAGGEPYWGSSLSDGERVGFYLTSHALLAPTGTTLLIDEPELHLHESIQGLLWDTLEAHRPDCTFVYITHDLGFAASRVNAAKVLLRGYETAAGTPKWDWQMAPAGLDLPEDVLLRIVGSRRPTVFVEGITGSVDQELYDAAYPDRYIVPSDNCDTVIQSVHSFRKHDDLHRFQVCGIIDRDDRDEAELGALAVGRVHALGYAQAENVLAAEEVMRAFCAHQKLDVATTEKLVSDAKARVLDLLRRERDVTIALRAQWRVRRMLRRLSPAGNGEADLVAAVEKATADADTHAAFTKATEAVDAALTNADYDAALQLLRNKGVLPVACGALGAKVDAYRRIAAFLIRENAALRASLSRVLPTL